MAKEFDTLIVDDEPIVIEAARKILRFSNLSCDEALDAKTALAKLGENSYRVIVTDLMLPQVTGFSFFDQLETRYSHIPRILITGFATISNALESFRHGAFDFVPKPFELEEFLGTVNRAMRFAHYGSRQKALEHWLAKCAELKSGQQRLFLGCHAWAMPQKDGVIQTGAAEAFAGLSARITKVDLPAPGHEVLQGSVCAKFTDEEDRVHTLWSPVSGRVVRSNSKLAAGPDLVNSDPFGSGWVAEITPADFQRESGKLILR